MWQFHIFNSFLSLPQYREQDYQSTTIAAIDTENYIKYQLIIHWDITVEFFLFIHMIAYTSPKYIKGLILPDIKKKKIKRKQKLKIFHLIKHTEVFIYIDSLSKPFMSKLLTRSLPFLWVNFKENSLTSEWLHRLHLYQTSKPHKTCVTDGTGTNEL